MADIGMDLYRAYEDGYKKGKEETEAYLLHCGDVTPVTNADKIRAMTDEELSKYLQEMLFPECQCCPAYQDTCDGWARDCETMLRLWLKKDE